MDSVQLSQQMKQFRLYLRPIINTLNKCLQLSSAFQASANRFFCEDTHRIATLILECSYYQYDLESTLTRRNFDYQKHICFSNLTPDQMYAHFLDNQKTSNHHSIVDTIRELSLEETNEYCSEKKLRPKIDQPRKFTSDYQIRPYHNQVIFIWTRIITDNRMDCWLDH
ncbi:unnamed protein product [Adineta ricciae]|uniref:Uncharacterized protein n=1 Tax=Adineta ricciae TaxID=249248 RepID=A0A815MAM7_ADIRI|nr:unnamed protein product [Adineta ricciae]CAF1419012.1 unnamed protein product [Adineta ricciae]